MSAFRTDAPAAIAEVRGAKPATFVVASPVVPAIAILVSVGIAAGAMNSFSADSRRSPQAGSFAVQTKWLRAMADG
jgi:hypothetical protein